MDRIALLTAAAVALSGCNSELDFTAATPEIAVLPDALDFGEIVVNEETSQLELFVQNNGFADLVSTLDVQGEDADAFALSLTEVTVERDKSITIYVTFAPDDLRTFDAEVAVASPGDRDPDRQLITVPLTGIGRVPYAPDIELLPATVDSRRRSRRGRLGLLPDPQRGRCGPGPRLHHPGGCR